MEFQQLAITPDEARSIIESNALYRNLNANIVRLYAEDMRQGRWLPTGDPIKFDDDGHLIDGMHRLSAIVQSGVTSELAVCRGVPREAVIAIDGGFNRTLTTALRIAGLEWLGSDVSLAIAMISAPYARGGRKISRPRLGQFMSDAEPSLRFVRKIFSHTCRGIGRAPVQGLIGRAYYHEPVEQLEIYAHGLFSGEMPTAAGADSILRMRNWLLTRCPMGGGGSINQMVYLAVQESLDTFLRGGAFHIARAKRPVIDLYPLPRELSRIIREE